MSTTNTNAGGSAPAGTPAPGAIPAGGAPAPATPAASATAAPATIPISEVTPLVQAAVRDALAAERNAQAAAAAAAAGSTPPKTPTPAEELATLKKALDSTNGELQSQKRATFEAKVSNAIQTEIGDLLPKSLVPLFTTKIAAQVIEKDGVMGVMGEKDYSGTKVPIFTPLKDAVAAELAQHPDVLGKKVTTGAIGARGNTNPGPAAAGNLTAGVDLGKLTMHHLLANPALLDEVQTKHPAEFRRIASAGTRPQARPQ